VPGEGERRVCWSRDRRRERFMAVGSGGDVLVDERRAILVLDRSELAGLAITDYNSRTRVNVLWLDKAV